MLLLNSQGLADNTVISKVNNGVWDLDRPLEEDCSLVFLKFDDEEAQAVRLLIYKQMSSAYADIDIILVYCTA